jgi:phospholipid N-methyltransferase
MCTATILCASDSAAAFMYSGEKRLFFNKFLRSPLTVGSVTPSSQFLTNKMMKPIEWGRMAAMAELGAGTGVFTRAIHQRSLPETQVIVFEHDADMGAHLKTTFPTFHHRSNALELTRAVFELGLSGLDCIVSGLPFGAFSRDLRSRFMDRIVHALKPEGIFIQFQYSLQMLPELRQRFTDVQIGFVPLNLPPAFVYVCRK